MRIKILNTILSLLLAFSCISYSQLEVKAAPISMVLTPGATWVVPIYKNDNYPVPSGWEVSTESVTFKNTLTVSTTVTIPDGVIKWNPLANSLTTTVVASPSIPFIVSGTTNANVVGASENWTINLSHLHSPTINIVSQQGNNQFRLYVKGNPANTNALHVDFDGVDPIEVDASTWWVNAGQRVTVTMLLKEGSNFWYWLGIDRLMPPQVVGNPYNLISEPFIDTSTGVQVLGQRLSFNMPAANMPAVVGYTQQVSGTNPIPPGGVPGGDQKVVSMGSNPASGGTVLPATASQTAGTSITIKALPKNANWAFSTWHSTDMTVFADAQSATTLFTVPNNPVTVTAVFTQTSGGVVPGGPEVGPALLLVTRGSGTVNGSGNYPKGSVVNIHADPTQGFKFARWEVTGVGSVSTPSDASTTLKLDGNMKVTAVFVEEDAKTYELKIPSPIGYTVTGEGRYKAGEKVDVTAELNTANVNTQFSQWKIDSIAKPGDINSSSTYMYMPEKDFSITFITKDKKFEHNLRVFADEGGDVKNSNPSKVVAGEFVELEARAAQGFKFDKWVSSGGGSLGSTVMTTRHLRFDMPNQAVTLTATFKEDADSSGDGAETSTGSGDDKPGTDGKVQMLVEPVAAGTAKSVKSTLQKNATSKITTTPNPDARNKGWSFEGWFVEGNGSFDPQTSLESVFKMGANTEDVVITARYSHKGSVKNNNGNITIQYPASSAALSAVKAGTEVVFQVNDTTRKATSVALVIPGMPDTPTTRQGDSNTFSFIMPEQKEVSIGIPVFGETIAPPVQPQPVSPSQPSQPSQPGPVGPIGPVGPQGEIGPQGPAGTDGSVGNKPSGTVSSDASGTIVSSDESGKLVFFPGEDDGKVELAKTGDMTPLSIVLSLFTLIAVALTFMAGFRYYKSTEDEDEEDIVEL